ncbi:hypothetical protein BKA61DRAFT_661904 [Leptodontidium sp. MPI-SDFR-AT-0119]|nr:hypothetical protein BKA61DRAFT_661904 [Leptodontidium sp. MPI-SDFR-AT-0119]
MSIYHIISLLSLSAATSASPHLLEPRQSSLICPQDNGQDPPLCSSSFCSWSPIAGSCMTRLANQKLSFWECGCCTADKTSCDACGGDAGNSTCVGGGDSGLLFKGCECYNGDGGLPPIFPFPVVPVGWPPPPVGVPRPSKECLEVDMPKCSDCEGINGWCFAGIDVNKCPAWSLSSANENFRRVASAKKIAQLAMKPPNAKMIRTAQAKTGNARLDLKKIASASPTWNVQKPAMLWYARNVEAQTILATAKG